MVRRVTPEEYNRLMREAARKQQDAINQYNREVQRYNRDLERRRQEAIRAMEQHNRNVSAHNREVVRRQNKAIDDYNRAVRSHNDRVRANQQRQRAILSQLNSRIVTTEYSPLHTSAVTLNDAYSRLEKRVSEETSDAYDDLVLGLPGRENTNSLEVVNALLNPGPAPSANQADLQRTEIENELNQISADLDSRWRGALFALNPRNPDAARHFCTSAREIISQILDIRAPDFDVVTALPTCATTRDGKPTRRSKIDYILHQHRIVASAELGDFVEADVNNVVELFQVFNSATHGEAGKYDLGKLLLIKNRVEGGIMFLSRLAGGQ